jgi:hypothetical protein
VVLFLDMEKKSKNYVVNRIVYVVIREASMRKMEGRRVAKLGKSYLASDVLTQFPEVDEALVTWSVKKNMDMEWYWYTRPRHVV